MADLMEYVNVLADQIGPRPVSTEEEHQASLYIAQELTDDGLDVSVDEFATPSGVRWPYVIAFALAAVGTFISGIGIFVPGISLSMFIIGLILVVAGLFFYYTEHYNKPFLSKMRAGGVSQNVVAKYIPEGATRETRRRKIIIAAHVDTVRAQPEASPKLIDKNPLLRKIIFYCMIGLPAVLFIRLLPLPWPEVIDTILWVISLLASVYVLAAAACIVASRFTPYISGGNDNASAIAVLLNVAHMMVNPDEREHYTRDRGLKVSLGDESLDDADPLDPFAPSTGDDGVVMHNADEAIAEGLVPEGVEITYDDDGVRDDATVAFPALTPEEQLDVLADTAAEELHFDTMSTGAFSLDDVEFDEQDEQPAPAGPGAISEMQVPDLDITVDEELVEEKPAERLDDSVIFAEYMGTEDETEEPEVLEAEVAEEPVAQTAPKAEARPAAKKEAPIEVAATTEEVPSAKAAVKEVAEEKPAPAPIYQPIETPTRSRDEHPQVARPVPSWYAAAKEKAAKDLEKKSAEGKAEESEPTEFSYRSRFADAPAARGGRQAEPEDETVEQTEVESEVIEQPQAVDSEQMVDEIMSAVVSPEVAQDEQEQPEQVEEAEVINLDIPDDQLDELSPDASGMFARVAAQAETQGAEKTEDRAPLTSRIPNIGSSDDKEREERKSAAESRAARGARPELESIPTVEGEDIVIEESEFVSDDAAVRVEVTEQSDPIEPIVPATERVKKKPTARHLTEQFRPTRAAHNRDIQLGENRQEAPVSSTFEDTPQATPVQDPLAPKDDFQQPERPTHRAPRQRTEFTAVAQTQTTDTVITTGNTSSFPALTGTFPALTDAMPTVDAGDFTDTPGSVIADDSALDSFMAAGQTTEIKIPESRFRNAVDKVGGLFNRKGRDEQDDYGDGNPDVWNDEDDFGWKGGGYFEQETESAFDAVRQRAAQIRETVVSMTEADLLDKEVWFVALGASSAGGQGMKNFLDLHSSELRGSLIINLEAVGAGTLAYVDTEGTGKPHRADRRLMSLVKKASKEIRGSEMKAKSLDWRNTDATPAMMAGMRALTIMGFADNGVAPVDWHCADDTASIVENDKLDYTSKLLLKVIELS